MKTQSKFPLFFFLSGALLFSGCASIRMHEETDNSPPQTPESVSMEAPEQEKIDLLGLQSSLKMNRSNEELGYAEKSFNTCGAGFGYSSTHQCRKQTLAVIHFQLQCRDSEGTISTTNYETQPVISEKVKWTLGSSEGYTRTDASGYGQVRTVMPTSQRHQKLRLTVEGKFLILTAGETKRVVAPKNWCPGAFTEDRPQSHDDPWGHVTGY